MHRELIVMTPTQWKTHALLEWQVYLAHTHPECGSTQELAMLVSHPVFQISSASSKSQTPCGCPQSPVVVAGHKMTVGKEESVHLNWVRWKSWQAGNWLPLQQVSSARLLTRKRQGAHWVLMPAGEGGMHTIPEAATLGVLLSNCSLQSIKSHTVGQRDGKEHVASPYGPRRSAKTATSKMLVMYWGGWDMLVQLHLITWSSLPCTCCY